MNDSKRTYRSVAEPRFVHMAEVNANGNLIPDLIDGKIPSSELPSYVDDIVEGYLYNGKFYEDVTHTIEMTGEKGKIYVDLASNNTYRWSGSAYIQVAAGISTWEAAIKDHLVYNDTDAQVECGTKMEVDGDLVVNSELNIGTSGTVGSDLKNAIIPDSSGHLDQVLMHITSGDVWGDYTPLDITYKNSSGSVLGSLKFVKCTQAEYNALATPDANTFYIIVG